MEDLGVYKRADRYKYDYNLWKKFNERIFKNATNTESKFD